MIGCLLRENGLFTQPLPGGLALDEAIAPTDMHGQATGRLYQRVYESLAEGGRLDLRGLLSDLAAAGEGDLAPEATEADAEVDRALGGREEQDVEGVFLVAAERWLAVRKEHEFEQEKAAMLDRVRQGSDPALQARLLERTREHVNGRASPVRILRPRR